MTISDYDSSQKQDPFYNQDLFIFMGKSYFQKGMSWAMRYRSADVAATYDVDAFVHPNSGCPGNDHLRWSLVLARTQHPFNTCPFWFQSFCGFRRRNLNSVEDLTPITNMIAPGSQVDEVILERGRSGRGLSTSTSSYTTASCSSWTSTGTTSGGFTSYSFFLVWNTVNADEVAAKELFLAKFASVFGVTRGAGGDCANYAHKPSGASSSILMCTEVSTSSSKNWFPAPYGYANIFVPNDKLAAVSWYFMRNHDNANMNSITTFQLHFFIIPNTGCTYYDFEEWSAKSPNNTIAYNYYPMTTTGAAEIFSTTVTTNTDKADKITMSSTSCTVTGWNIFAPYLYNQLTAWSSNPKFASTFNTNYYTKMGSYYNSAQYASSSYATSTTMAFSTAYYKYTFYYTTNTFAKALKYAILTRVSTKVDSTYGIHTQPIILQRNSGCADYDALLFQGHTDAFDWPMNREALNVTSYFGSGRRSLRSSEEVPTAELDAFNSIPQDQFVRRLSAAGCIAAYDLNSDQTNSWTLHITYVYNNPTNAAKALALCNSLYTSYGGASCTTAWSYSTTASTTNYYGNTNVKVMGAVSPVSTTATATGSTTGNTASGLQYTYSYAINVPDAYLSTILQTVMPYTASTTNINANLGWFLVPNLYSTASSSPCSLSDIYSSFYIQEEPRPWIYAAASGSNTSLTTSLSTTGRRRLAAEESGWESRTLADASSSSACGNWKPSSNKTLNFVGFLRKYYCDFLNKSVPDCLITSLTSTKTGLTTSYDASSYINGNDYLPPIGCDPTTITMPPRALAGEDADSSRELQSSAYTESYTVEILNTDGLDLSSIVTSVESGSLSTSTAVTSAWASLHGVSTSSVTFNPFKGGRDALGNNFGAVTKGSIAALAATEPNPPPGTPGTTDTTTPSTNDPTTPSTTTTAATTSTNSSVCNGSCIAGIVVGSVCGLALLAGYVYAKTNAPSAKEVAAPVLTTRAASVSV